MAKYLIISSLLRNWTAESRGLISFWRQSLFFTTFTDIFMQIKSLNYISRFAVIRKPSETTNVWLDVLLDGWTDVDRQTDEIDKRSLLHRFIATRTASATIVSP